MASSTDGTTAIYKTYSKLNGQLSDKVDNISLVLSTDDNDEETPAVLVASEDADGNLTITQPAYTTYFITGATDNGKAVYVTADGNIYTSISELVYKTG